MTADKGRQRDDEQVKQSEDRAERQPMGGYTQNLKVDGLPDNMVPRWFNHKGGRIAQARKAGYQPVLNGGGVGKVNVSGGHDADMEQWVSKRVGSHDGAPLYAFLMAIKKEWYDEDQAKKFEEMDQKDRAILEGPDAKHVYVKEDETHIERNVALQR